MKLLLKKVFLVKVLMLLWVSNLSGQAPDTLWTKTYGGANDDYGYSVQQTTDGGYIIAGSSSSFTSFSDDIYIIKTDSLGDTVWTKIYGGEYLEVGNSVQQTSDGGYIITGLTTSFGAGSYDIYLLKTDPFGDTLWAKTYGGQRRDVGCSVQQTKDGDYIIAGYTESFGAGEKDVYLIKTDSVGNTLWTKTYGGKEDDYATSVQCTSDQGYIIVGNKGFYEAGSHYRYVWLLKTDDKGDTLWTKTYSGIDYLIARSVQQTADGGYIIVADGWHISLIKTDSLGDTLWTKTYSEGIESIGLSVQQTSDDGYIVAGTINLPYVIYEVYLIKTDASGDTLWTKTYGGVDWGWDFGLSAQITRDGGYIVVANTRSYGAGGHDVWLLKIAPDTLGVQEHRPVQTVTTILQVSPNPFKNKTDIRYQIPSEVDSRQYAVGSIRIYDIAGRLVKSFSRLSSAIGHQSSVTWDGTDNVSQKLPSGVYFLKFQAGDYKETKKLILLR